MTRTPSFLAIAAATGLALAAQAQGNSYEPQRRLRTPLDTCSRSEMLVEAYCIMKCQAGFRMDSAGGKARCVATRPDAKYEPPKPSYEIPPPSNAPKVPGA